MKKEQAQQAIKKLNEYKKRFKLGQISYDTFKSLAKFYIDRYNIYNEEMAKKAKIRVKKLSIIGFLR